MTSNSLLVHTDKIKEKIEELTSILIAGVSDVIFCSFARPEHITFINTQLRSFAKKISFYDIYYRENEDLSSKLKGIIAKRTFKGRTILGEVLELETKLVFLSST